MINHDSAEAFELLIDPSDLADGEYDALRATEPYDEDLWWMRRVPPKEQAWHEDLPAELWFWAALDRIRHRDFLHTDVRWVICSRRMLDCLRSVGEFPHKAVPVHFREADRSKDGTLEGEFYAIIVTETTDALDAERSVLIRSSSGRVKGVNTWAFRYLPGGLPPLFRVPERKGVLLVSREAKDALEASSLTGFEITAQDQIGSISSPHLSAH